MKNPFDKSIDRMFGNTQEPKLEEVKNTLKSEHLKAGVSPIMAGVGTPIQFKQNPGAEKEAFQNITPDSANPRNVNYYGNPEALLKQQIKNAGRYSYVISPIDSADKFSASFLNCTGLVATGLDKKTGENISFLSHQEPHFFLREKDNRNRFIEDLRERLAELKNKSAEKTVDAVIVGGNYFENEKQYREDYLESIKLLSAEVKKILEFEPVVMIGPKTISGEDDVFYDNEHRRLYIMRPEVGKESTKSFIHSDIENQEKKWKEDA